LVVAEAGGIDLHIAHVLDSLGNVRAREGERAQARELYERSLAIFESTLGPEHHALATPLANLAGLDVAHGRLALARERLERALRIQQAALGADRHEVVETREALAEVVQALERGGAR